MNILKCLFRICATLCLIAGTYSPCFSDGSFFPVEVDQIGNSALSPNQRAVIIHDGENETMIVQVKYSGNVQDFAWVIPLPALPDETGIQIESDSIFTLLHDWSQPKVYMASATRSGGGGGGEGGSHDEAINEDIDEQAKVWQTLSVGPYDVQIISGNLAESVRKWLNDNGYAYSPSIDPILNFYIRKNWYFMAAKVSIDMQENGDNSMYQAGLPAIKVTFPIDKAVFPLRISEISSARKNEIEVYLIADHRMISDTYPTYAMNPETVDKKIRSQIEAQTENFSSGLACACNRITDPVQQGSLTFDYESIFQEELASHPSGSFIIEYVDYGYTSREGYDYTYPGSFDGFFDPYFPEDDHYMITRLRTVLSPDDMTDDVIFIPDPNGDVPLHLSVFINQYNPWQTAGFGLPFLLLLPIFLFRTFRKRYSRHILLALLALYLILL